VRLARILSISAMLALAVPVSAQDSGDEPDREMVTPLGSHVSRPAPPLNFRAINEERAKGLVSAFSECLYEKAPDEVVSFLERSDFGLVNFAQMGETAESLTNKLKIDDCMTRAVRRHGQPGSTTRLQMSAANLRNYALRSAYLGTYPDGPTWIHGDQEVQVDPLSLPLSQGRNDIIGLMNFADCIVAGDPQWADFFFRTGDGSKSEGEAIQALMPTLSACLPEGQEITLTPTSLRVMLSEGVWHVAMSNSESNG
jgi:hypothetical protein